MKRLMKTLALVARCGYQHEQSEHERGDRCFHFAEDRRAHVVGEHPEGNPPKRLGSKTSKTAP